MSGLRMGRATCIRAANFANDGRSSGSNATISPSMTADRPPSRPASSPSSGYLLLPAGPAAALRVPY